MKPLDYVIAHDIVQSTVLKFGGLGAYPQGNFQKLDYYLGLNFVAILIPKTYQLMGCPTLKMSLLIVASSVCIPAVTIYTHNNLLHFATFIIIISLLLSFLHIV